MTADAAGDPLLTRWARLLFAGLARAGVRDVIVSPGSRSTPFVHAALHTPELRCHSVWDERSAAFFALGLARVSGRPAALLCTSGSAAANYFPAVVEASTARLPLVVVTADRPLELQAASAAQTIDQIKLYGDFARQYFELGTPDPSPSAAAGLLRMTQQAVLSALYPEPGPVHLNARARKPLEPAGEIDLGALLARAPEPVAPPAIVAAPSAIATLGAACARADSGVIVVGPESHARQGELAAIAELGRHLGFPVLAEATSQLRFGAEQPALIDGFDFALRSADVRRTLVPELVLRFGAPPTSTGLEWLLAQAGEYHVVASHGYPDPGSRAQTLTLGNAAEVARALTSATAPRAASAFAERWQRANASVWHAVEQRLASAPGLREGVAVRSAVDALPRGSLLVLGNSLPVREVDQYARAGARGLSVVCQRGANGIDGIVSGAAGAAFAFAGPALLLVGDVSFLHDLGGLDLARRAERPLVILVVDNGGGRIFEQLPMATQFDAEPEIARYWLTPPGADLSHAAALFGLPYVECRSQGALSQALAEALERRGATVVRAEVEAHSAKEDLEAILGSLKGSLP